MKKHSIRTFFSKRVESVISGATLGFAMSIFASIGLAEAQDKASLTVAMSLTPLSSPVIIAKQKGYFAANDLDVTIKDFIGGNRTIKAVFEGKADMATSSEAVVMFNSMKRSDFAILSTFVTSDNDVKIITRRDTGIRNISDLLGRRVGTVTGSSSQFFLDQSLLMAGVDASKVKVIHVNPENAPSLLSGKKVDAIAMWEPSAYLSKRKLGKQVLVVSHDKVYTETFNAIALKNFVASNPAAVERFLRALSEAIKFIIANPEESQQIVARRINKDIAFIRSIWSDFKFDLSLHQWLITTLETEARWAIASGLVKNKEVPNYLDFIHLDTLDRVRPNAVTVIR